MVKKNNDELSEFVKEKLAKLQYLAPMNNELQKWLLENKVGLEEKISLKMQKEIMGKCTICRHRKARYRCIKCNREVCAEHYWILYGLCKKCVSTSTVEQWRDEEKRLGIDIIR